MEETVQTPEIVATPEITESQENVTNVTIPAPDTNALAAQLWSDFQALSATHGLKPDAVITLKDGITIDPLTAQLVGSVANLYLQPKINFATITTPITSEPPTA